MVYLYGVVNNAHTATYHVQMIKRIRHAHTRYKSDGHHPDGHAV